MTEAGVRRDLSVQGLTEGATRVEKLDIPLGSARPGVDTPIEQHVDGLSHFQEPDFVQELWGERAF